MIPEQNVPPPPPIKPDAGKGKLVLVIDDDPTSLELVKGLLLKYSFDVATATNGIEARSHLKPETPHLIVTDILMPEMDGFTFFKELRKNPISESIPVIILTSRKNMEESFLALGANAFLSKPLDAGRFTSLVVELLRTAPRRLPAPPAEKTEKPKD